MTSKVVRADVVTIAPQAFRSGDATSDSVELGENLIGTPGRDDGVVEDRLRACLAPDFFGFGRVSAFPDFVAKELARATRE